MKRQPSIFIYIGIFILGCCLGALVIVGLYRCLDQPAAPVTVVESSAIQQRDTARIRLDVTPYRSLSNPQK